MKLTFNNIFDFAFDVHSFICMIFFVNWNVRRRSNNEFSFYCTTYFRYYWKNHLGNFVGSRKYSQCSPFSCVFLGLFGDEVSDLHRVDPLKSFKIKINLTQLTVLVSIAEYDEMCWSFSGLSASAEASRFFAKAVRVDLIPWVPVVHRPMVTIFSCLNLLFNLHEYPLRHE